MLQFYTASLTKFKDNGGDILDITRMTGSQGLFFAPSWELLNPFLARRKNGLFSPEDWKAYREGYLTEMRASVKANPDDWATWRAFIQDSNLYEFTLSCYCEVPDHCHRSILAEILVKRGATYLGERQLRLL